MDFAMLESAREFTTVIGLCRSNASALANIVFIDGMSPVQRSRTEWFFTRTGGRINNIPWRRGEPDGDRDEFCLSLWPRGTNSDSFLGNDARCNARDGSILCEKVRTLN